MKTGGRVIAVGLLAACALVGFSAAFALAAGADSGPRAVDHDDARAAPDDRASADIPAAETTPPSRQLRHSGRRQHCPRRRRRARRFRIQAADVMRKALPDRWCSRPPPGRCELPRRRSAPSPRSGKPSAAPASRGREPSSRCTSGSPVSGFEDTSRAWAAAVTRAPVSSRLILRGTTVRATRSVDGRRLERLWERALDPRRPETGARSPIPLSFGVLKPPVAANKLGPCGRDPSRLEQAPPLRRSEADAHLRRRDRPGSSRPRRAASRS